MKKPCGVAAVGLWMQFVPALLEASQERWALTEELRFEGSSSLPLSTIQALVASPNGTVFVAGAGDAAIHRLAPSGEYDGVIGREGDGPGEFRVPPRIGVEDDVLWALDRLARRTTRFSLSGRVLDATRVPPVVSGEGLQMAPIALLEGGRAVFL